MSATPTRVTFRGKPYHGKTAKEAYVWLVERFAHDYAEPFKALNWETEFIAKGRTRSYFARNLAQLYPDAPHLAAEPAKYSRLPNGWYVALNLSNEEKLSILHRMAAVAKLKHGDD